MIKGKNKTNGIRQIKEPFGNIIGLQGKHEVKKQRFRVSEKMPR